MICWNLICSLFLLFGGRNSYTWLRYMKKTHRKNNRWTGLELLKHQQCPIVDICNTSPCLCNLFSNQCSYFFANLEVERLDLKTPCAAAFLVEDERHTHPSRCGEMKEHYNETGSRKLLKDKSWRKTLGTLRSEETLRFDLGTLRSDLGTLRSDLISGINCMRSMLQDPLL